MKKFIINEISVHNKVMLYTRGMCKKLMFIQVFFCTEVCMEGVFIIRTNLAQANN
jgi:hypothetical protein